MAETIAVSNEVFQTRIEYMDIEAEQFDNKRDGFQLEDDPSIGFLLLRLKGPYDKAKESTMDYLDRISQELHNISDGLERTQSDFNQMEASACSQLNSLHEELSSVLNA